jgi:hypothetical protein
MSGTHFYLTVPSNASLGVFPDNKTTKYLVKLPQPIDLDGNWEVVLYSISYPNTWYTLRNLIVDTHFYYSCGSLRRRNVRYFFIVNTSRPSINFFESV